MRWIWIRHGETEENREGRYLGHTDVPLNDAGVEQAALLARQLGHERPAHFLPAICSAACRRLIGWQRSGG